MTPLSPLPFLGFTITLAGDAVVEAVPAPYSNTKEVIFNNQSGDRVFVAIVDITSGFPAAGSLNPTNSVVIYPKTSFSVCFGPEGERQPLATTAFWTATPGANLVLVAQAEVGAPAVDLHIAYVQNRGGGGG